MTGLVAVPIEIPQSPTLAVEAPTVKPEDEVHYFMEHTIQPADTGEFESVSEA
mgnify:CR=1 FL=1